ncbi:hypothetical protein CFOLD11_32060 [Clostridium folliculivorans]|uniref:Uncharacterized protein n=1 Tax=Clostridium folliculivorans TaxID=2886038 RepID=A0A9W5Y443_9CLOT|nr:hypothetical protein [Clostridium folliculivorans]GKU26379.1 hypothetical protein CFOLD11_32060 [Clostridium folliculivorans]
MRNRNKFIDIYTEIPDNASIRSLIVGIALIINVFNYMLFSLYNTTGVSTSKDFTLFLIISVVIFDIFSLVFYIIVNRINILFHLYTAISLIGSSIFYFFMSSQIFIYELDSDLAYTIIGISLLIYVVIIVAVISNIRIKIKNTYVRKTHNKKFAGLIGSLGAAIGITISKHITFRSVPLGIIILLSSYLLIPTISGFHKFYLVMKNKYK